MCFTLLSAHSPWGPCRTTVLMMKSCAFCHCATCRNSTVCADSSVVKSFRWTVIGARQAAPRLEPIRCWPPGLHPSAPTPSSPCCSHCLGARGGSRRHSGRRLRGAASAAQSGLSGDPLGERAPPAPARLGLRGGAPRQCRLGNSLPFGAGLGDSCGGPG